MTLPDLPTMSIDCSPAKEPKLAVTPPIVAVQPVKLTVPKLASLVMLPPIEGLSAMHSAEERTAEPTVKLIEKDCPVVTSLSVVVNWPARLKSSLKRAIHGCFPNPKRSRSHSS